MKKINLLWFKKDLRIEDHLPLTTALQEWTLVVWFFCFEPSIMNQPDWSWFHGQFIKESLVELKVALEWLNVPLLIFKDEVITTLENIKMHCAISWVYSHEETWNMATYQRDLAVKSYLKENGILFVETPTNWVVRKLRDRDIRNSLWKERMHIDPLKVPWAQSVFEISESLQKKTISLWTKRTYPNIQHWWISYAQSILDSFLNQRYSSYTYHVWRPYESTNSCGRISPYLTYGNLSLRRVYHATRRTRAILSGKRSEHKKWTKEYTYRAKRIRHIDAFTSRLHRHCHFIQKLESETDYEFKNIHPYYDRIRTQKDQVLLDARKEWRTWYPLIDAAMRCLQKTWWINFRLRATLVSFICNTCLQDRKEPAHHLAKLFVDYEPWIHYPQFQMQAGTTGINQYRIYNPTKQALDKDADGVFIDTRVPELRNIPMPLKAQPRKVNDGLFWSQYWVKIWVDYPLPIIDLEEANRKARKVLRDLKKSEWFREIAHDIYFRHGSRKKSIKK